MYCIFSTVQCTVCKTIFGLIFLSYIRALMSLGDPMSHTFRVLTMLEEDPNIWKRSAQ